MSACLHVRRFKFSLNAAYLTKWFTICSMFGCLVIFSVSFYHWK